MDLNGKRALVLGASRNIGWTIAEMLAGAGARLALPWFDWPDSAEELATRFSDHLTLQVDLRQAKQVQGLAATIQQRFGGLDILINNIERGGMPVVHGGYERSANLGQWRLEMETTLEAKFNAYRACLPMLKASGAGAVINISSIAGVVGRSGPTALLFNDGYSAANRAIASLTATWAREAAPEVRVNEIMLGLIEGRHGPGTRGWALLNEQQRQALIDRTLLGRIGTAQEVAAMVKCVLEQADFMTGSVIRLDGGYVLGGDPVPPMPAGVL